MKALITTTLAAIAVTGFGAPVPSKQHVPERLDKVRLIRPAAATKNHILVANVGKAIPEDAWGLVSTYAISRLQLNVWTNAVDSFDAKEYVADPGKVRKDFGEKTKIVLFVVNDPKLARITCAPGFWCAVNVRGVDGGDADRQTVKDRYAKLILKGLAFACGGGASLDSGCSLFYGSFTSAGMDKTGIMISPTTYFPMLEILRSIGGGEILTPALEE